MNQSKLKDEHIGLSNTPGACDCDLGREKSADNTTQHATCFPRLGAFVYHQLGGLTQWSLSCIEPASVRRRRILPASQRYMTLYLISPQLFDTAARA
jgi:hypothetical protein